MLGFAALNEDLSSDSDSSVTSSLTSDSDDEEVIDPKTLQHLCHQLYNR